MYVLLLLLYVREKNGFTFVTTFALSTIVYHRIAGSVLYLIHTCNLASLSLTTVRTHSIAFKSGTSRIPQNNLNNFFKFGPGNVEVADVTFVQTIHVQQ